MSDAKLSVVVLEDAKALADHVVAWQELADSALEPNPFYAPWMFLPALPVFGAGKDLRFVLVQATQPGAAPVLCGFFPLEIGRRYSGLGGSLPISTIGLWKHPFGYLCTPLLRAERAVETLAAFFAWLEAGSHGCTLAQLGFVAGDGPFHQLLVDHLQRAAKPYAVTSSFLRALFRPGADPESDQRSVMHPAKYRELKRHERRLADAGPLEYRSLEPGGDVDAWIEEFLEVEAISWKGRAGRALVSDPAEREYFSTVAREAFRRGQLMMLALRLGGRTIAAKCNFVSAPGSFAFKIAYDEEHARHSPGVLLELENIRRLHARPEIRWMDSCADASHPMLDRLWPARRTIEDVLVGARLRGDWFVALLPFLRQLRRRLLRRTTTGSSDGR
jgi:hypothetical protein